MKDALDIFIYGNATVVIEALNAIAMLVGEKGYKTVFQISSIFALTYVVSQMFFGNSIKIAMKWFLTLYMVMSLVLIPKVDVLVSDPNFTPEGAVSNVPVGIAWPLSIITSIEKYLTESFESNFSTPDDLRYSQTGTIMTSDMVRKMSSVKIHDQDFSKNLQNFIQECVQYDLLRGRYPVQDLMHSEDVWKFVTTKYPPSHARAFLYDKEIQTCADGAEKLEQEWGKTIKSSTSLLSKKIYTIFNREPMTDQKLNDLFKSRLTLSYANLTGITKEASEIMQQNMMINAYHDAVLTKSSEVGAAAAVESYAVARATQNSRSQYKISGEVAGRLLPYIKAVIQVLLIGAFPIMAPLFVLGNGIMLAKRYFQVLLSLSIWGPLYAILNLQMTSSAKANLLFVAKGVKDTAAITIANLPGVEQVAADQALLAGYLALSVPLIAWGLVSGSMYAFASLASNVMAGAQSASGIAANEASTGNISLGNLNLDNVNAYNTSAFKLDDNASYMSGSMSMQRSDGVINTGFDAGNTAIDTSLTGSNLPVSANLQRGFENIAANHSITSRELIDLQTQSVFNETVASSHRMFAMGDELRNMRESGHHFNSQHSAEVADSLIAYNESVKTYAHETGQTIADAINTYAKAEVGLSVPGFASLKGGAETSLGTIDYSQNSETFAAIEQSGIRASFQQAQQGMQGHRFNEGSENLKRMEQETGESLEDLSKAQSLLSTTLADTKATSEAISVVASQGAHLQTDITQDCIERIKTKINPDTKMPYSDNDIAKMSTSDIKRLDKLIEIEAQSIAQEMVDAEKADLHSSDELKSEYDAKAKTLEQDEILAERYDDQKAKMKAESTLNPVEEPDKIQQANDALLARQGSGEKPAKNVEI